MVFTKYTGLAVVVLLAGCAGSVVTPADSPSVTSSPTATGSPTATQSPDESRIETVKTVTRSNDDAPPEEFVVVRVTVSENDSLRLQGTITGAKLGDKNASAGDPKTYTVSINLSGYAPGTHELRFGPFGHHALFDYSFHLEKRE